MVALLRLGVIQLIWSEGIESMTVTKPFRYLYIKTTNLTHGYQDNRSQLSVFYQLWAPLYDFSVWIDPAYKRNLFQMVKLVVQDGDAVLDVGCGTGLATVAAAENAQSVVALDPSQEMLSKLQKKLKRKHVSNVEIIHGYFPHALADRSVFDSIVSSFTLAHFSPDAKREALKAMFDRLAPGGRLGLFGARGEIATSFQTRDELLQNLSAAGFKDAGISDVSDIYRIATATRWA